MEHRKEACVEKATITLPRGYAAGKFLLFPCAPRTATIDHLQWRKTTTVGAATSRSSEHLQNLTPQSAL